MSIIQPIPRPWLAPRLTIPTGGWTIKVYLSDSSQYDTTVTATLSAGDYYIAWDMQSDDLIYELNNQLQTAITALGGNFGQVELAVWIDSDHKVNIGFGGTLPMKGIKLAWTEEDGASIAPVLGFDESADDANTSDFNPIFTGDYHHQYGWYADEDGLLANLPPHPADHPFVLQDRAPTGHVTTQYIGSRYDSVIELQHLPNSKVYSFEKGYGDAPQYPSARNEPLECWFREARKGTPFRVYRDGQININRAVDRVSTTGGTTTTVSDSAKNWQVDQWQGCLLYTPNIVLSPEMPARFYISSNTATQITVVNAHPSGNALSSQTDHYIMWQQYLRYWLRQKGRGSPWSPREIPNIDRFNISFDLAKFES